MLFVKSCVYISILTPALVIFRYLEKKLDEKYTAPEIIETLRNMEVKLECNDNYTPNYIRTDLTDALHEKFGFRTDYEVSNIKNFKKIFKQTTKERMYAVFIQSIKSPNPYF